MTISFSGLISGLDTSSWVEALVSVKQEKVTALQEDLKGYQSVKDTLNSTKTVFSDLRSAIEKLTDYKFGGSFDLFAKNTATSSNEDIFTATATNSASRQNYDIFVQQLATYTKAVSSEPASAVADDSTELSNIGITEGTFTVYVDGVKTAINIEEGDTLGDLKSQLASAGVKAEIDKKGVLSLSSYDGTSTVDIGATTDSSNLTSLLGLAKQEDGSYASTSSLFKASTASVLTSAESGFNEQITAGTFTIGDATFTIDEKTTLSSLISQINSSDEAQAYAYWDDATGKLNITSTKEGASYINIEAGTSNFTDVMGLTQSEWDADGNLTSSRMLTNTQELGQNAILTVNGTTITSTSNTVSSDISRIEGVTLTLKGVSTEETGNTTLNVEQDTTQLVEAVKGFVEAYNAAIDKINEVTASGADLHGETTLTSIKNSIRGYANGSNTTNGGVYSLLSQLGISTAEADGSNLSTDTDTLSFDEEAFTKALQENPDSVESLLAGENGILTHIENTIEQALSATTGFFDVKTSSIDSDISRMEDKISKQESSVETYRAKLENQFYQMEMAIAQMQQNYSSFLS